MKILLINGAISASKWIRGQLNQSLADCAHETLKSLGHEVTLTIIQNGYDPKEEVQKFLNADVIMYQFPVWWFSHPWIVKKYIDDVFSDGWNNFVESHWKTNNPLKEYGRTGLLKNKIFIINTTWSAPKEIFEGESPFLEGKKLNDILFPIIKQNEFVGMKKEDGFHCFNVNKISLIEEVLEGYKKHLLEKFNKC